MYLVYDISKITLISREKINLPPTSLLYIQTFFFFFLAGHTWIEIRPVWQVF